MKIQSLLASIQNTDNAQKFVSQLGQEKSHSILSKYHGAALSFLVAEAFEKTEKTFLLIFRKI